MTLFVASTDNIGTTTRYSLNAADDNLLILAGVTVGDTSVGGKAINVTGVNTQTHVFGSVFGHGSSYAAFGDYASLTIHEGASMVAYSPGSSGGGGNNTLFMDGNYSQLTNHGTISSTKDIAIGLNGVDSMFSNYGTVSGETGIFLNFASTNTDVVNGGTIMSEGAHSSTILPWSHHAIYVTSDEVDIVNLAGGRIIATSPEGAGIRTGIEDGDGLSIVNRGEISSVSGIGVDLSQGGIGDTYTVRNYGVISGASTALEDGENGNLIVNAGLMIGNVYLNGGNDTFRTRLDGNVDGTVNGGAGNDYLMGGNRADSLAGGINNDTIQGHGGNDDLSGDDGDDRLAGGAGDDSLDGGMGEDTIRGQDGEDLITGDRQRDVLTGGADADTFDYNDYRDSRVGAQRDVITDFVSGEDMIDLQDIGGGMLWRGGAGFTGGGTGEVRFNVNGAGNTIVQVDINGDATADMHIELRGVAGVAEGDFIL